jgi:hypothetical protein
VIEYRKVGEIPTLDNRRESYETVDKKKRYKQILEIMIDNKEPMTAKEISVEMYKRGFTPTSERNFSSPRITELLRNGTLDVIGKKKCKFTGKTVSVYAVR